MAQTSAITSYGDRLSFRHVDLFSPSVGSEGSLVCTASWQQRWHHLSTSQCSGVIGVQRKFYAVGDGDVIRVSTVAFWWQTTYLRHTSTDNLKNKNKQSN